MLRLPPRSTRTDTLFPYTTLFRSSWLVTSSIALTRRVKDRAVSSTPVNTPLARSWVATVTTTVPSMIRLAVFGWDLNSRKLFQWKRSEEHTSELQSLMRISYAVFCLKKKKKYQKQTKVKQVS